MKKTIFLILFCISIFISGQVIFAKGLCSKMGGIDCSVGVNLDEIVKCKNGKKISEFIPYSYKLAVQCKNGVDLLYKCTELDLNKNDNDFDFISFYKEVLLTNNYLVAAQKTNEKCEEAINCYKKDKNAEFVYFIDKSKESKITSKCVCSSGYKWNIGNTECVKKEVVCSENQYKSSDGMCYCKDGYKFIESGLSDSCIKINDINGRCKDGYIQKENRCISYSKICQNKFGNNVYGEDIKSNTSFNKSAILLENNNITCYCFNGYNWLNSYLKDASINYCVKEYDTINLDNKYKYDEYIIADENDLDGDGIINKYDKHPNDGDKIIKKIYDLSNECKDYLKNTKTENSDLCDDLVININIPEDRYYFYKNYKPHVFTNNFENISSFVIYDDVVINDIVNQIYKFSIEKNFFIPVHIVNFLVAKISYETDLESTGWDEYPKYAIETLVDGRGDCEDTSYLAATLFKAFNEDVVLVRFPGHLAIALVNNKDIINSTIELGKAIGINIPAYENYMWKFNNEQKDGKYLEYIETTNKWTLNPNIMPESLMGKDYWIYEIGDYKKIVADSNSLYKNFNNNIKLSNNQDYYSVCKKNYKWDAKNKKCVFDKVLYLENIAKSKGKEKISGPSKIKLYKNIEKIGSNLWGNKK